MRTSASQGFSVVFVVIFWLSPQAKALTPRLKIIRSQAKVLM